MIIIEYNLIA